MNPRIFDNIAILGMTAVQVLVFVCLVAAFAA